MVAGLLDQRIKAPHVELKAPGPQRIARRLTDQPPAEQYAQLGQVHVGSLDGAGKAVLAPQLVDQSVARDRTPAPSTNKTNNER